MTLLFSLILSMAANAGGLIYQNASATLTSTPSLITYTTPMTVLGPQFMSVNGITNQPSTVSIYVGDPGYVNGVYTCARQGTFSVNANLAVAGTLAANSSVVLTIQLAPDGVTFADFKTEGAGPTTGLGKAYGKVNNLVPCPAGGAIRIMGSTSIVLPTLSAVAAENSLSIFQIF